MQLHSVRVQCRHLVLVIDWDSNHMLQPTGRHWIRIQSTMLQQTMAQSECAIVQHKSSTDMTIDTLRNTVMRQSLAVRNVMYDEFELVQEYNFAPINELQLWNL